MLRKVPTKVAQKRIQTWLKQRKLKPQQSDANLIRAIIQAKAKALKN